MILIKEKFNPEIIIRKRKFNPTLQQIFISEDNKYKLIITFLSNGQVIYRLERIDKLNRRYAYTYFLFKFKNNKKTLNETGVIKGW